MTKKKKESERVKARIAAASEFWKRNGKDWDKIKQVEILAVDSVTNPQKTNMFERDPEEKYAPIVHVIDQIGLNIFEAQDALLRTKSILSSMSGSKHYKGKTWKIDASIKNLDKIAAQYFDDQLKKRFRDMTDEDVTKDIENLSDMNAGQQPFLREALGKVSKSMDNTASKADQVSNEEIFLFFHFALDEAEAVSNIQLRFDVVGQLTGRSSTQFTKKVVSRVKRLAKERKRGVWGKEVEDLAEKVEKVQDMFKTLGMKRAERSLGNFFIADMLENEEDEF